MRLLAAAVAICLNLALLSPASAQNCPALRKINVGVAVAPPNVVHTAPYVAKALGLFAKHCVDATIIQFDGGAAVTSVTAQAQGRAISNLPHVSLADCQIGRTPLYTPLTHSSPIPPSSLQKNTHHHLSY